MFWSHSFVNNVVLYLKNLIRGIIINYQKKYSLWPLKSVKTNF